jgi:hypothetical protein
MEIRVNFSVLSRILIALAGFVLMASIPAVAVPSQVADPDFGAIDAYVETQMQGLRIPGLALGIVHGDQSSLDGD